MTRIRLLLGVLALTIPALAPASTLYTNFGAGFSYDITSGDPVGNAFDGNNYAEGATFTPTSNGNFGSVELALSCVASCGGTESFTVSLRRDSGSNAPGALVEAFNFSTALGLLGVNNTPIKAISVLQPLLTAGTFYWITVASSPNYSISWNLNSTSSTLAESISSDGGATWFSPSGLTPGAFQIDSAAGSTVPEPVSSLLIGSGLLLGVAVVRRRFR